MNLLQLKYFQEVARYQNITKTAEILHVSQPSLSTSIKHLEEELGIELFDRKGKSIVLNEDGQNFLRDINSVFELLNRNQMKRNLIASGKSNAVFIGGSKSELKLYPFIARFLVRHPDVLISVKNCVSLASLDPDPGLLYLRGAAGIGIRGDADPGSGQALHLDVEEPSAGGKRSRYIRHDPERAVRLCDAEFQ